MSQGVNVTKCCGPITPTNESLIAVWTGQDCQIVSVRLARSSILVGQRQRNTGRRRWYEYIGWRKIQSYWPKDLECHAGRCNIFPIWIFLHLSLPAQSVAFSRSLFRTSSSDTDCILTFSLILSVPSLRRFCCLRSTIWCVVMWHDVIWYATSLGICIITYTVLPR